MGRAVLLIGGIVALFSFDVGAQCPKYEYLQMINISPIIAIGPASSRAIGIEARSQSIVRNMATAINASGM